MRPIYSRLGLRLGVATCVLITGCYTGLPEQGHGGADAGQDGTTEGEGPGVPDEVFCSEEVLPVALPNLVRLTHRQYENTVAELLGIADHPAAEFLPDATVGGFDNNADTLAVTDRLARDYRRAAEDLAEQAVSDPELLANLVPCDSSAIDDSCVQEFIADFGRRALRRPLSQSEAARYFNLYRSAGVMYAEGSDAVKGLRVLLEAFLQSPYFLYRIELPQPGESTGAVPLTGYELASRLSYLLWNSMPDDELLRAAEAGDLDEAQGVAEQARRLIADPRAAESVADFHRQWLKLSTYLDVAKDPAIFPDWDPEIGAAMQEETQRFIRRIILEQGGTFGDLLTSASSVVNDQLAAIYGISGDFGPEFVPVDLDPEERAGIITQIGFLASQAYTNQTNPIKRGVFVHHQLLCTTLPPPPPNVPKELPELDGEVHTTRDAVALHTSPGQCSGCHSVINEPGFALEGYDAIGRVRTEENGWPIDASAKLVLDGAQVEVDGGVEMAQAIANSEAGRQCYLTQWFRYANMRMETEADTCTLEGLHEALRDSDYSVEELLVALSQTATFRFRTAGEP